MPQVTNSWKLGLKVTNILFKQLILLKACSTELDDTLLQGGFLVQRSIQGRAVEMGLKISLLV